MKTMDKKGKQSPSYWKKYFRTEVVDNKNIHTCLSCDYSTTVQIDMSYHVRKHMKNSFPFVCTEIGCDKAFKTKTKLSDHRINHRCGFGIQGMEDIGICGANAIKTHYEMIVEDNQFKYVCKWKGCEYSIKHLDSIEKHVHSAHICPYRTA